MSTICARQTCFCGLLRSDTTASKRSRSAGVTSTVIPVRIPPIRMARRVDKGVFLEFALEIIRRIDREPAFRVLPRRCVVGAHLWLAEALATPRA